MAEAKEHHQVMAEVQVVLDMEDNPEEQQSPKEEDLLMMQEGLRISLPGPKIKEN